jgi:Trypsin-like peptidase domain
LADEKDIAVGADVNAIGHPENLRWSYTKGIISQIRNGFAWSDESKIKHHADVIQTQTPINPGNSGGPLLSDDGKLIGVNTFVNTAGTSLNFAVSTTGVRRFLAATNSVIASNPAQSNSVEKPECAAPKVIYDGRNKNNDAFIKQVSLRCDNFADIVSVLPDNTNEPLYAWYYGSRRDKPEAIIFDPSRLGKWKFSFWDLNFDNTFPLEGIHSNGSLNPVRFKKRCNGQALPNFKCL